MGVALAGAVGTVVARPGAVGADAAEPAKAGIDFNRDVRPILSDHCFRCHGPDASARKAGLRLDTAEGARELLKTGHHAIVPGRPDLSAVVGRICSADPEEVMPPPSLRLPLDQKQKEAIVGWISAGAVYQRHWAFVPPRRAPAPEVKDQAWARDPVDRFVLARMQAAGLEPAPEADRPTLLRRVGLALTGLPPTPEETAAFVSDTAPDAYERRVDEMLGSVRFGERMASDWLDAARYADTFGYQSDWECRVWPWRDWVIDAFNQDMPYDRFLREQIAGDLLPGAGDSQRLATTFSRLHRQTNEGGSIDAEFRQEYTSDRVHTFGTAILGMTLECARCHDHKYDPISQRDYYSLCAFFGQIDESGTYPYITGATPAPTMRLPTPEQEQELRRLAGEVTRATERVESARDQAAMRLAGWLWSVPSIGGAEPVKSYPLEGTVECPGGRATEFDGDAGPSFADSPRWRRCDPCSLSFWMRTADTKARATVIHTSQFTIEADEQGFQVMLREGRLSWEVVHLWPGSAAAVRTVDAFPVGRWVRVCVTYDGSSRAAGLRIYLDGKEAGIEVERDHLNGVATARPMQVGFRDRDVGFKGGAVGGLRLFDRELTALEVAEAATPGTLEARLGKDAAKDPGVFALFCSRFDEPCRAAALLLRDARAAEQDLLEAIPEIMVMEASERPRRFFVLRRGRYDDPDPQRPVSADRAIDAVMVMNPAWPKDRLGLADWTTDRQNPLVARVEVNRLWAMCFGRGLVVTQENFGMQGDPPSHPEVLDTLAADFIDGGWRLKQVLRRIVLSATFRQGSEMTSQKQAVDPQNVLLARGPAWRLPAEMVRDQALFASGLLAERIGGPSVKPWQPPGLWEDAGANAQGNGGYQPDSGENAHRRSLYTFRKRTAPPPNMLAFDAGSREQCLARRQPTSTPLQPLVLLNDRVFWECAQALAGRAVGEAGPDRAAWIDRAFRLLAGRGPRGAELAALERLYDEQFAVFAADPGLTRTVAPGEGARPEVAAMTMVASTLLASDQTVTSR